MMEPNPNPLPQSSSGQTSIWTVDESQQQLAAPKANEKDQKLIIFTNTSKKSLEVFLIFTIFIISILSIALGVTIYLVSGKHNEVEEICTTPNCLRAASTLLHSMNLSRDPCDNFYNYVCGNFRVENPMTDPFWQNSWFTIRTAIMERDIRDFIIQPNEDDPMSVQLARTFFGVCLDYDGMEENGLETFWDVLNMTNLPKNPFLDSYTGEDWPESMAKVRRILGFNLLIGIFVLPSITNSTVNQIAIASPGQVEGLIPGFTSWNHDKSNKLIQKMIDREVDTYKSIWLKQSGKMAEYLIKKAESKTNLEENEKEKMQTAFSDILAMMRNQSLLERSPNISKSIANEVPVEMSFDEMQAFLDEGAPSGKSKIDIKAFIATIYESYPDIEIDFEEVKLLVHQKHYFKILSELLDTIDNRTIGQYIWWNVLYDLASHINEDLTTMRNQFVSKMLGDYPISTRTSLCLETVSRLMAPAVGFFMVEKTSDNKIQELVKMIALIKKEYKNIFSRLRWMDEETIKASKMKLEQIKELVGIPFIMERKEILVDRLGGLPEKEHPLDSMYNVTIEEDFHLNNLLKLISLINDDLFKSITFENNLQEAYFDPFTINAYYDPSTNSIQVPAGIIQFPFYDLGVNSLNYGAIGTILGHELSHAFDNIGRLYDGVGNVRPWWSEKSISNYEKRAKCFENEYDRFVIPQLMNATVDGKFTLGENLADDGGLKVAYEAFLDYSMDENEPKPPGLEEFTHLQLFFIGFANIWCSETAPSILLQLLDEDEHSPDFVRVNTVLRNFIPFSEAFECKIGSGMNPESKCVMWE